MTIQNGTYNSVETNIDNVVASFSRKEFNVYLFEAFKGARMGDDIVADHRCLRGDHLIQIFTLPDGPVMTIHNLKTDRVDVVRPFPIAADGSRTDQTAARESNVISFPGRPSPDRAK